MRRLINTLHAVWLTAPTLVAVLGLLASYPVAKADDDILSDPERMAKARKGYSLQPVPLPDLSRTEESVQEVLRSVRSQLVARLQPSAISDAELAEAFGEMGGFYLAHRLFLPAEACFRNAEALAPEDYRWSYYLGYLYQEDTKPDNAVTAFERVAEMRPDLGPAQLRLGEVYLELNELDRADALFRRTVDTEGLRGAALFGLGRVALARQDFEQAVRLLEQALQEQPRASRIHYPLAMAYRGLGDADRARQHLARFGEGEPRIQDTLVKELDALLTGARTHLYQGIEAVRAGHYEKAVQLFTQALTHEPDNVNARVTLARALYLSGDRGAAEEELQEALRREPNHELGNFLLGVLLEESGSPEAASRHYRVTLNANPDHGGAHFYLANALMRQGNYTKAASHYARAVEQVAKNFPARLLEAMALVRAGAPDAEVRDRLRTAVEEHPDEAVFQYALARLLAASPDDKVRDGQQALELSQALSEKFNRPETVETLAMAKAELGRFDEAVVAQQKVISAAWAYRQVDQLPRLQENLEHYQAHRPCRTPWVESDPIFLPPPVDAHGPFLHYPTRFAY